MREPAQHDPDLIKKLQYTIQALTEENRLLKQHMEEAGISYADIVADNDEAVEGLYDPDQEIWSYG